MTTPCEHCGGLPTPKSGKPRSLEQHRRFFALIKQAYTHWPEMHETQFVSEEDCRKWLCMKAGWRDVACRLPLIGIRGDVATVLVQGALKAAGAYARAVVDKGDLVVIVPRSISFAKMGHTEFCRLNEAVAETIEAETGIKVDDLMREAA